jgi:hypothetical protein
LLVLAAEASAQQPPVPASPAQQPPAAASPAQQPQPQPEQPRIVNPGRPDTAPSDAIVLLTGPGLAGWTTRDGQPHGWTFADGILTSAVPHSPQGGTTTWHLTSKTTFTDAQIHLEFAIPNMPDAKDQAKGNSGVLLQGRYEVQLLDSWRNATYPDGSNAALYGQYSPLVNASLPPEEWQTFDMIFHPPKCAADGSTAEPGSLTLVHNRVLVHDHVPVVPRRGKCQSAPGPLVLQDHYPRRHP